MALKGKITLSFTKFVSILSKENYKKLSDSLFDKYYKLEDYIFNITNVLNNDINNLILFFNDTSEYLRLINDLSYDKIIGYHNILTELIEKKYKLIVNNNKRRCDEKEEKEEEEDEDEDPEDPNEIKDFFGKENAKKNKENFRKEFKTVMKENFDLFTKAFDVIEEASSKIEEFLEEKILGNNYNEEDYENIEVSSELSIVLKNFKLESIEYNTGIELKSEKKKIELPAFISFFIPFPILQFRIVPALIPGLYFNSGFNLNFKENEYSLYLGISAKAEVSISFEIGAYIPILPSGVEIKLAVGIKGLLGSGEVGIKLSIFINKPKYEIDLSIEFKALEFTFFILFQIKVEMGFFSFSFKFYLMNEKLCDGIGWKKTKKIVEKIPKILNSLKIL